MIYKPTVVVFLTILAAYGMPQAKRLDAQESATAVAQDTTVVAQDENGAVQQTDPLSPDPAAAVAEALPAPTPDDANHAAGWNRTETLLASLTIFMLAVFLGLELIAKVPPTLHTPLMSGSNAISGITLVGAVLVVGVTSSGWLIPLLGTMAVIMATVNAVGGFAVTHRMLAMFRRK